MMLLIALNDIAVIECEQGNDDAAKKNFKVALQIARKAKFVEGVATYSGNLT